MQVVTTVAEIRAAVQEAKQQGKRVGFVPTMGNLHDGHIQLIHQANQTSDFVVSSIFVNPLQFGAGEDLEKYPRTLQEDIQKLTEAKCDLLFAPTESEVYPHGREAQTEVEVPGISDLHCGASRPGHFRGVATVVCKLFGIVQPDTAVFGEKDFQQLRVIRRMTEDLCIPVEIQGSPIARAQSGLALSSRNGYLTAEEKDIAAQLFATLTDIKSRILAGNKNYADLAEEALTALEAVGFKRDYFAICNQADLTAATPDDNDLVILAAAYLGKARLIDNVAFSL